MIRPDLDSESAVNHWRRLTQWTRLTGIAFAVGGIVGVVDATRRILDPSLPFFVNGVPDDRLAPRVFAVLFCAFFVVSGVAMLMIRAYRPDLGDRTTLQKWVRPHFEPKPYSGPRSWWTGDPKSSN